MAGHYLFSSSQKRSFPDRILSFLLSVTMILALLSSLRRDSGSNSEAISIIGVSFFGSKSSNVSPRLRLDSSGSKNTPYSSPLPPNHSSSRSRGDGRPAAATGHRIPRLSRTWPLPPPTCMLLFPESSSPPLRILHGIF